MNSASLTSCQYWINQSVHFQWVSANVRNASNSLSFNASIVNIFSSRLKIIFLKTYFNMCHSVMISFTMHVWIKGKCWFIGIRDMNSDKQHPSRIFLPCFSVEGKSRSPTIACFYIMTVTGISWSDVMDSVRGVRTLVCPNFAFQKQLKYFYDKLMLQVNRGLKNDHALVKTYLRFV